MEWPGSWYSSFQWRLKGLVGKTQALAEGNRKATHTSARMGRLLIRSPMTQTCATATLPSKGDESCSSQGGAHTPPHPDQGHLLTCSGRHAAEATVRITNRECRSPGPAGRPQRLRGCVNLDKRWGGHMAPCLHFHLQIQSWDGRGGRQPCSASPWARVSDIKHAASAGPEGNLSRILSPPLLPVLWPVLPWATRHRKKCVSLWVPAWAPGTRSSGRVPHHLRGPHPQMLKTNQISPPTTWF